MNTKIRTPEGSQTFTSFNRNNASIGYHKILVDHTPSLIFSFDEGNKIAKLIKPRRPLEVLKMLIFRSRIHKELRGNKTLKSLGFNTPTIHQHGYAILPKRGYRYIGFYTMDNLARKGLKESTVLFNNTETAVRQAFFNNLYHELATMKALRIVFSDLTFGNMFVNNKGAITWIDTGITNYRFRTKKRFQRKYNFSIKRFIDIHQSKLSPEEISSLNKLLFTH